jgi:hypothetical protein
MLRGSCAGDAAYMSRKALTFGIVLLALVPATRLAWLARDMPHLGHFHDDSIYLVSAKSLAEGHGYRILSLPAEPFQTKYPPLWPLILAAIWKIAPHFPENLKWEMALTWLMLPLFVGLAWRWFRAAGLSFQTRVALCAVLALNPWMAFLSDGDERSGVLGAVTRGAPGDSPGEQKRVGGSGGGHSGSGRLPGKSCGAAISDRRAALARVTAEIPCRRHFVLRHAAGGSVVDALGTPAQEPRARHCFALLHRLSRLPDLQRRLARPAAGDVEKPGCNLLERWGPSDL